MLAPLLAAVPLLPLASAAYSAWDVNNLPHTSEDGQQGYNDCGSTDSQSSMCQTAHMNSVTDFCLWAPPTPGETIGDSERYEVAWCTATGHGARVMPQGTIGSAHWLETPYYWQVTGTGDLTKLNIAGGDAGGELDPHGVADGNGNPIGGLVYHNGQQIKEWTSFISDTEYCFRICKDTPDAWLWCQHIYDTMGCEWNEPANYGAGFDSCEGEATEHPPGIYVGADGQTSTFHQGDAYTPPAMAAGASSQCQAVATVGGAAAPIAAATTTSTVPSSTASSFAVSSSTDTSSVISSSASPASSSFITSTLSSTASSSVLESSSSASSTFSSTTAQSTITISSTVSRSSTTPVSTGGQRAAASPSASTSSTTSGAGRTVAGVFGSLAVLGGAVAVFA
ncbi:hypothetical protein JCM10213_001239 [Rhodosporidiobolus nylandii]